MRWLGLIPARGGSKGIPQKNLAHCGKKTLLQWTAEAALGARKLSQVIVSTDDPAIADAAKSLGLTVPFLRPESLSTDSAPALPVMKHALQALSTQGQHFDGVVLLQPTSPFRKSSHIDEALNLFETQKALTVVSVVELPHSHSPTSLYERDASGQLQALSENQEPLRRQDKPKLYARNGPAVLALHADRIAEGTLYGPRTFGYIMDKMSSIDIDTPEDLQLADWLVKGRDL
jgi:CMP-N,N'-diacetyllegionaminic acid synthase